MSSTPPQSGYWVHDLDPFLIQFPEGFPLEGIRWYGVAYLAGFLVAALLLRFYYKKGRSPLDSEQQTNLLTAIILGTIIGGRLGFLLLYDTTAFLSNPLIFFQVWKGGMASHGGMLGIVAGVWWFARIHKIAFWKLADIVVTLGPAGVLFGRLANFINAELWGKPTEVAWAVIFPVRDAAGQLMGYTMPVHPSQLYEAALEGLFLLLYTQWRFWKTRVTQETPGRLASEFLVAYGLVRIFGELFREPDAGLILGISRGSFYSIIMIVGGAYLWVATKRLSTIAIDKKGNDDTKNEDSD